MTNPQNNNKEITIYCLGDELYPDDNGNYTLSDEEQEVLDSTLFQFDNDNFTRVERSALYLYQETYTQFGDLEVIVSRRIAL